MEKENNPLEKKYFGPEFIEQDIRNFPGSNNILETHERTQQMLGLKVPESLGFSLWLIQYAIRRRNVRQELILPENPQEEAIYWLGFIPLDSYRLQDSLLIRITDRPQEFTGISDHPQIEDITQKLRDAYDRNILTRIKKDLFIPQRDFALSWSFTATPSSIGVHTIYPTEERNIARDFEAILREHQALEELTEKGYKSLY